MLHKAWNSTGEMPYCFPRSSIKFQGHTVQNITDFDWNWAFPDYRPVAAFKSLRFALFFAKVAKGLAKVLASLHQTLHHTSPGFYYNYNFSPLLMILIQGLSVLGSCGVCHPQMAIFNSAVKVVAELVRPSGLLFKQVGVCLKVNYTSNNNKHLLFFRNERRKGKKEAALEIEPLQHWSGTTQICLKTKKNKKKYLAIWDWFQMEIRKSGLNHMWWFRKKLINCLLIHCLIKYWKMTITCLLWSVWKKHFLDSISHQAALGGVQVRGITSRMFMTLRGLVSEFQ